MKVVMTGRDGIYFFGRRDGTVHKIVHDGTGRYIISSTTGSDGISFFSTARGGILYFSRRDGTVRITVYCTEERNAKHTDLGTKAAVLQVQVTSYFEV